MRLPSLLGAAALLLCLSIAEAESSTVNWRFDFTSSRGSGFLRSIQQILLFPQRQRNQRLFFVVAADINITDPGWGLFGPIAAR